MKTNFKFPDDLVPGRHFVQYATGEKALVLATSTGTVVFRSDDESYSIATDFSANGNNILNREDFEGEFDVVHVYEIEREYDVFNSDILVWTAPTVELAEKIPEEEENARDMTISEIEEILGHKIRITG